MSLRVILRFRGYDVLYVQNITDVGHMLDTGEDRVLRRARQLSAKPMQVVETYTRGYFDDMDALNVIRPDISPRASGHVPEQIAMVEDADREGVTLMKSMARSILTSLPSRNTAS